MSLDLPDWAADELCKENIRRINGRLAEVMSNPCFDPQIAYELLEQLKKWQRILDMPPKQKPPQRAVGE